MTIGNGDPSRVAVQIVSGIGFIGGGLILKDGFNVRGLNTAATIWCSAACGTLSGVGLYAEAAVLVACVLITHCLFRPLCTWIEKKESGLFQYIVHVECEQNLSNKIQQIIMNAVKKSFSGIFYEFVQAIFKKFRLVPFDLNGIDSYAFV